MPGKRNRFQSGGWVLEVLSDHDRAQAFDCGDTDLNDFFRNDLRPPEAQLLTKTYILNPVGASVDPPVALISYCNDKIRLDSMGDIRFEGIKQPYRYIPAVKIARLGVRRDFRNQGIGTHLLNMTKSFFLTGNRTGCRVLTVDAYKNEDVTAFYKKSFFDFISSKDKRKQTRTMFYDLIRTDL
jgi:GNAT superfamily N-acetyltransferase